VDATLVGIAGTALTFGIWWLYDLLPSAQILENHRNRALVWGVGQILIVTAIVATGAGLNVAAFFIARQTQIGPLATVLSVALPVGAFLGLTYALYYYLVRRFKVFQLWLLIGTAAVVAVTVTAARSGVGMARCLVVLALVPVVTVVGYEALGYRHLANVLRPSE
jgi:hypothetical protein